MDGGQRAAQVLPDEGGFTAAERPLTLEQLLERAAPDELHPQPDAVAVRLDAVNRDHVAVTDAREQPAFVEDFRGQQIRRPRPGPQQLYGHVTAQ